jgi:hypothetical protein
MYLLFIWCGIRNGFEAGKIHYEGHWKGSRLFWVLKWLWKSCQPFTAKIIQCSKICVFEKAYFFKQAEF